MKISELIALLEMRRDRHGDIEVAMLDDETGDFEPVAGGFYHYNSGYGINQFELMTERQIEESEV